MDQNIKNGVHFTGAGPSDAYVLAQLNSPPAPDLTIRGNDEISLEAGDGPGGLVRFVVDTETVAEVSSSGGLEVSGVTFFPATWQPVKECILDAPAGTVLHLSSSDDQGQDLGVHSNSTLTVRLTPRGNRAALLRILSDEDVVMTMNVSGGVHFMRDLIVEPAQGDDAIFDASVNGLATRTGYVAPSAAGRLGEAYAVSAADGSYRLWVYSGQWRKLDLV